ncbi:MAG: glycosyltransferase family 2 protein [Gammaproteobacteria bacterium]|nr:glycosyltransferase family 2 protein [Gammaproteobacteria bacterium]
MNINNKNTINPLIMAVIPAYNEEGNLKQLIQLVFEQLKKLSDRYEVLIIDDGSTDNTFETLVSISDHHPLRVIQLTRNFGKENALSAGLDHAVDADIVILLDADFQHPLHVIPEFFNYWKQGYEMVYAVSTKQDYYSFFRRQYSNMFYYFMHYGASIKIEPHAGDFRLLDKKVVKAICSLPERHRFMKGLYSWVGFKTIGIPVQMQNRNLGASKYNFRNLLSLALLGITSFSSFPLRIWGIMGAFISLGSIGYGLYILLKTIIFGADTPGWATLVVSITFLSGVQLLSIGALGEYISRIFTEVKSRPAYLIRNKYNYDDQYH